MKLIVYVLSALLLVSCVSAGGSPTKQDVDISELQTDSNLQDALKYGINWVFEQAAKKYNISNLDIEVTQVNKIQKWKNSGSTYYYFDVEASNDYAYLNSTYTVKCNSKGVLSVVNKWSYTIDKNDDEPSDGGYDDENEVEYDTNVEIDIEYDGEEEEEEESDGNQCEEGNEVDASQIKKDSNLKKSLYYGLNWIFEKAAEKFNISEVGIELTQVNIICKWQENGYTYYYFDVEAVNCDNVTLNATYNVRRNSKTGELRVVNKWDYDINFNSQCKKVDLSTIGKNSELKKSLIYGLTWIFQKAVDKFDISESGIAVTKINSICSYKEGGYVYYSFDLEASNEDEDVVETTYNVRYETKTGKLRVVNEWKYNIEFNDEEETDDCEDQGYDSYDNGYDVEVDLEVEIDIENISYED